MTAEARGGRRLLPAQKRLRLADAAVRGYPPWQTVYHHLRDFTHVNNFVAKGSDGSKVHAHELVRFYVNDNGEVTVVFEKARMSCSSGLR